MPYPCTRCGACCRRLHALRGIVPDAMIADDGSCVHLVGNDCSIYDQRPLVCRIDEVIDAKGMDKATAYEATATICNAFMDQDGLDQGLRVRLQVVR